MNKLKYINFIILSWAISLAETDEGPIDFAVGGQAVIEGVMMRSPNSLTIAVRKPNGTVKVKKEKYRTLTQRYKWLNMPILRGVINLFEMMVVGTKAINFSANESLEDDPEEGTEIKEPGKLGKAAEYLMFAISMVIALALSIFLFKFLPLWVTGYIEKSSEYIQNNYIVFNLIDGILKMLIFLSYIFILSLIPSFRRVFEYHGAEHKSIFNYEKKIELTVENAKKQSRFHPRCGTSFVLIVFMVSILVYTFVPRQEIFLNNLLLRIALLPLIAGLAYEYLKLSAKHVDKAFVKMLVAPGLWFQRLTTKDPDDKQLEIGIKSLSEALAMEKSRSEA